MIKKFTFSLTALLELSSQRALVATASTVPKSPWLVLGSRTLIATAPRLRAGRIVTRTAALRARRVVNATDKVRMVVL